MTYDSFRLICQTLAELFAACRDAKLTEANNKQGGGWWCPVPAPAEGETLDFSRNCQHEVFARESTATAHFHSQHSDFGVWDGTVRRIRNIDFESLPKKPRFKCGGGRHCNFGCDTLEALDVHAIASAYLGCRAHNMHPLDYVQVSPGCLLFCKRTSLPTYLPRTLQAIVPIQPVHAPNLIKAVGADGGGEKKVEGLELVVAPVMKAVSRPHSIADA